MRARCPKCQQIVDYTAEESAQPIRCPQCQQAFRVKPAATAPPAAAKTTAPAKPGTAKTATAARPAAPAPVPLPIPVPQPSPTPEPAASSFDFGVKTGSPSASGGFVTTSRPAAKQKPKRRMSTAVLLSLFLGVPVVLVALCAG